jgi:hypothetical protein
MMKQLLTIGALAMTFYAGAQAVPNGGFETWTTQGTYEEPNSWATLNFFTLLGAPATTTKVTSVHSGTYAVKTETILADLDQDGQTNDTLPGNTFLGSVDFINQVVVDGVAFTLRPDSLIGWYKYTPGGADALSITVSLTKWDGSNTVTVADGAFSNSSTVGSYTRFHIPLTYSTTDVPDTLHIIMSASSGASSPGSQLWVDDLQFVTNAAAGVSTLSSTPALQFYPNPADKALSVIVAKSTTVEVYNALGMRLETLKANASEVITIQTSNYKNGVYFLKTESGQLQRFVIQH